MGRTKENRYSGTIIGHTVRFLPKKVDHRGAGITITKAEKIAAFVTIQADNKTIFTVPSKGSEVILEDQTPSPEALAAVYDILQEQHPFNSPRMFREFITRGKGVTLKRYELEE